MDMQKKNKEEVKFLKESGMGEEGREGGGCAGSRRRGGSGGVVGNGCELGESRLLKGSGQREVVGGGGRG
jgi:hypothetical protein